jgi:hypothetical protein
VHLAVTKAHEWGQRFQIFQANVFAAAATCSNVICGFFPPKPLGLVG